MPATYTQDTRIAKLTTPLGKDELVLRRFDAVEGMNELFDIRIEAIAEKKASAISACIGQICSVSFDTIGDDKRHFHGVLAYVQEPGGRAGSFVYRLVLRPWVHYLTLNKQSRIFHRKTAKQILQEVLTGGAVDINLKESYAEVEYTVQYRESDFAFACRLMEQYGIMYYFRHDDSKHTLCLIDQVLSGDTVKGGSREYVPTARQYRRGYEHLYQWIPERRLTVSEVLIDSYDFKRPTFELKAEKTENNGFTGMPLKIEDYPGAYVDKEHGERLAKARLDSERGADGHFLAAGDCVSLFPGALMSLTNYKPDQSMERQYIVLRATHTFLAEEFRSGESTSRDDAYHGHYEFIRSDRAYAPPRVTEKPFMQGPQTARVVGKGEIDVDEFGRIEVLFHWDRKNAKSRRVRLSQVWAGNKWGGIYIPRVGMEVIVNFIDGDPDQPIVTGTVYNGDNKVPFDLPGAKNIAGWKSNTTTGGGGYNELVFDDSVGKELIRMHGQYDRETTIKHDQRLKVGNNQSDDVKVDRTTKIGQHDTLNVGKNLHITAGDEIVLTSGLSKITMKKDGTIKIEGVSITIKGKASITTETLMSTHKGTATVVIQGGFVKIN